MADHRFTLSNPALSSAVKKIQFQSLPPDLGVQRCQIDRLYLRDLAVKCGGRVLKQLLASLCDLVGMQAELFGHLCLRLVSAQSGQGHLGLERQRMRVAGPPR